MSAVDLARLTAISCGFRRLLTALNRRATRRLTAIFWSIVNLVCCLARPPPQFLSLSVPKACAPRHPRRSNQKEISVPYGCYWQRTARSSAHPHWMISSCSEKHFTRRFHSSIGNSCAQSRRGIIQSLPLPPNKKVFPTELQFRDGRMLEDPFLSDDGIHLNTKMTSNDF